VAMQMNDLDHARLRRLAALRPDRARVLSIYVDLDPAEFGTQPARASQISSLLDEADRRARETQLDHDARAALRADLERVRELLRGDGFSAKGAHGLAIFACGPAGVFEVLRLPEAVAGAVVIDEAPWLDPLVGHTRPRRCLALVSRRTLRVLLDHRDGGLREVAEVVDDVHGQHEQGGWSQARYERSIEEDVRKHLERAARVLFELQRREPFDVLAVGATAELWPELERELHPYLRGRTLGRFDVDVEHATVEEALRCAQPLLDQAEERRLRELLDRLQAGLASGDRAVAGAEAVRAALVERRVEALLYETGREIAGLEDAIAAALEQSAAVVPLRDRPELGPHGGIAALLRF
jgi:peptide chain release factor subunit 1